MVEVSINHEAVVESPGSGPGRRDSRPPVVRPGDDRFVPLAEKLGAEFGERAAQHDGDNTFVADNFDRLRESGFIGLAVPETLGGLGASLRQVCFALAELARGCAATALAVSMHQHVILTNAWRWRHGATPAEGLLRRIAAEKLVVLSTGGNDWVAPTSTAVRVEGGFRITGRKVFCSQAPTADLLSTWATYDDPDEGKVILGVGLPASADGLRVIETWDTLGMRGTGSHDIDMTDVFASDAQVTVRRPWGVADPLLLIAAVHAMPVITAVYWGLASGARDVAVRRVRERAGADIAAEPQLHRQVGLMDAELRCSWWSLLGALDELGEEPTPTYDAFNSVMLAKRQVVDGAIRVTDLAMDVAGGASYFRRLPLERAYRDARAGRYHPVTPEDSLYYAGRVALGLPPDRL